MIELLPPYVLPSWRDLQGDLEDLVPAILGLAAEDPSTPAHRELLAQARFELRDLLEEVALLAGLMGIPESAGPGELE
jgi:hypothetical protein